MKIRKLELVPIDTAVIADLKSISNTTEGGIYLTDVQKERTEMTQTEGVLSAIGDGAFEELKSRGYNYPKVGDLVYFKSHSGILVREDSRLKRNKLQRVMQDIDIYAINKGEEVEVED